jgi:hypothetical protein
MRKAALILLLALTVTVVGVAVSGVAVLADQIGPGTSAPAAVLVVSGGN